MRDVPKWLGGAGLGLTLAGAAALCFSFCRAHHDLRMAIPLIVLLLILLAGFIGWQRSRSSLLLREQKLQSERDALERSFAYLTKFASDIIVLSDDAGQIVWANEAARRTFGGAAGTLTGARLNQFRAPGHEEPLDTLLARQRATPDGFQYQTRQRAHDGRIFAVEVSGRQVQVDGRSFYLSIGRDITEQQRMVNDLRRLNRAYAALSEVNQLVVRAASKDTLLRQMCRILVSVSGYRFVWLARADPLPRGRLTPLAWAGAQDIPERAPGNGIPWSGVPDESGPFAAALRERRPVILRDAEAAAGWTAWGDGAPTPDCRSVLILPVDLWGGQRGVAVLHAAATDAFDAAELVLLSEFAADLTYGLEALRSRREREQALLQVREREARLQAVFAAADTIGFVLTDAAEPVPAIVEFSPGAENIFGRRKADTLGRPVAELHAPDAAAHYPAWLRRLRDTRSGWSQDVTLRRADGGTFPAYWSIHPLFDGVGQLSGCVEICMDESQHKELEQQFFQAQKLESIGRLASGVAHDFNNIIQVVIGHAAAALRDAAPDNPLREDLQEIQQAGRRAAGLTRQLLAFSRRQTAQPVVFDVNSAARDTERMLQRVIGEDVTLTLKLAASPLLIHMDPDHFNQILMNLSVNARDAMPRGGQLLVESSVLSAAPAWLSAERDTPPAGPYVQLAVSDTGCGMSAEVKKHLFEPFYTTKAKGQGTGLGLATVYGIIRQSGGHIHVYSELEHGTTLKIYWPLAVAETAPAAAPEDRGVPAADTAGTNRRVTILLAEDDDRVRRLMGRILKPQANYRVIEAHDGAHALALAAAEPGAIDLLITDVVMPNVNGRELAERIARARPGIKILFISGFTQGVVEQQGIIPENVPFLAKPFAPEDLLKKVRQLLQEDGCAGRPEVNT